MLTDDAIKDLTSILFREVHGAWLCLLLQAGQVTGCRITYHVSRIT